jgi:hypothetical protein
MKLIRLNFVLSRADTLLFIYNKARIITYLLVYVDDVIMTSSTSAAITTLLEDLHSEFALKDPGALHYFLGMQVSRTKDSLVPSQERYASKILQKAGMLKCKPVRTPLVTSEKLSASGGTTLSNEGATWYMSIVGGLQYLTLI